MLLTLKPPGQNGVKGSHEYSIIRQSIPTPRSSPPSILDPPSAAAPTAVPQPSDRAMESSGRGLPPPTLPPPDVPSFPVMTGLGQHLPPPPAQWHNADDAARYWLQAKAEEDRWKQEEERTLQEKERTRQETLRLEQRKIEQSMLRDSLHAGVPPHMVPMIFAGISGASVQPSNLDAREHAQHHQHQHVETRVGMRSPALPMPPPQLFPQQMELSSPLTQPPPTSAQRRPQPVASEIRRESRTIPPNPYAALPGQQSPMALPQSHKGPGNSPPTHLGGRASDARSSSLARLTTTETQAHNSYTSVPPPPSQVSTAAKQDTAASQQPSPSISFHHWVPPGQSQPNTPSGRSQQGSPLSSQTHSHLRSEYQSSPGRKRKAQGVHQAAPSPSSHTSDTSAGQHHSISKRSPRRQSQQMHGRGRSDLSGQHESQQLGSRGSSPGGGGPTHGAESVRKTAPASSEVAGDGGKPSAGDDETSARQDTPVNYIPYSRGFHDRSESAGGGRH